MVSVLSHRTKRAYNINMVSTLPHTRTAHTLYEYGFSTATQNNITHLSRLFQHCNTEQTHNQAACDPLTFPVNTECRFCCHRPACIYSIAAASTSSAPVQASTVATMAGTTTPPPVATTLQSTTPAATGKTSFAHDNRTIGITALKHEQSSAGLA